MVTLMAASESGGADAARAAIPATPEDSLARENAYLRLRNAQLQEDVAALSAEIDRLRQAAERLQGRRAARAPNPLGAGQ